MRQACECRVSVRGPPTHASVGGLGPQLLEQELAAALVHRRDPRAIAALGVRQHERAVRRFRHMADSDPALGPFENLWPTAHLDQAVQQPPDLALKYAFQPLAL